MNRPDRDDHVLTRSQRESSPDLAWVDDVTRLLDTKYRIPGTSIRFGVDFLMGLVPGLGDVLSMGFSGLLIATMVKKGISLNLVMRMLLNVILDTVVGSIPILGNLFDLFFKANRRNLLLMRGHYVEGKHTGSVWPVLALVMVVLAVLLMGTCWIIYWVFRSLSGFFPVSG